MKLGPNPSGLCMCGCGEPTGIAPQNRTKLGWVKGQPVRFAPGHQSRAREPKEPRLEWEVDEETGCWVWQRAIDTLGYGRVGAHGHVRHAHRVVYEKLVGPVPPDRHLDHLCRNRACVNPEHLEPVTHATNLRRGAQSILDMEKARRIRQLRASGMMIQDIARLFSVSPSTINGVVHGRRWVEGLE